jgi:hypothetical protein
MDDLFGTHRSGLLHGLAAALANLKIRLRRSHDRRQVHHGHRTPTAPGTTNDDRPQCQRESGDVEEPGYIVRERNTPPNQ